jgi:release factor glutamine methyltransferase
VGVLLTQSTAYLEGRGVRSPRVDAEHLLAHALGLSRLDLYLDLGRPLEPAEVDVFRELVRRRAAREPLAYILGSWSFRGLALRVDPRALVPRPETEILVDRALEAIAGVEESRVLDVGTGTGAIALAVAHERPDARVVATDVSAAALELAGENARALELEDRVELVHGDLLTAVPGRRFHLVVSNPPYVAPGDEVDPEVERFEPAAAVFAPAEGMGVLRRLVAEAPGHLEPGGVLAVETGEGQARRIAGELEAAGFTGLAVHRDLARVERIVVARWPGS